MPFLTDKKEIIHWLDTHKAVNYIVKEDEKYGYVVDVHENLDMSDLEMNTIDVKFNEVFGYFSCKRNNLRSLEGCPEIVKNGFDCSFNQLKDLKHITQKIGKHLYCSRNQLQTLEGCPPDINGMFDCSSNQLNSLLYGPKTVKIGYSCSRNNLKSLENLPDIIDGYLFCENNDIESLMYFPSRVKEKVRIKNNSKLGNAQEEENFEKLYELHLQTVIEHRKIQLEQKIKIIEFGINKRKKI